MYQAQRLYMQVSGVYMYSKNAIMPTIERKTDTDGKIVFEYGADNQKSMNQLVAQTYMQYELIPEKLTLVGYGGVNRFFSNGDNYTHNYTTWFGGAQASLYLGKWSVSGSTDSRYRALFGETIWYNEYSSSIDLSYKLKNTRIGIGWMYPFQSKGLNSGEKINNSLVQKRTWNTIKDYGNMVTLNFVWNISTGRKYKDTQKRLNNSDSDTGIVK